MTFGGALRAISIVGLLMSAVPAAAEPDARPWSAGVSAKDQTSAWELFTRGNELHKQDLFAPAIEEYRKALALWDHPAIRYNVAVALIDLVRPVEAYQELELALRFGPEALEPEIYQQAMVYERQLRAQVVRLALDCVDLGMRISLDGRDLGVHCPTPSSLVIPPGPHQLIASKPGYVTHTLDRAWSGGATPRERFDLKTNEEATVRERRWKRWKPWAIVGAGTAVGLVGLGVQLQSAATYRSFDRAVGVLCPDRPCDSLPPVVSDAYAEARRENRIAIGLFAVGGATLATGAILLWVNRAVTRHVGYESAPIVHASFGPGQSSITLGRTF